MLPNPPQPSATEKVAREAYHRIADIFVKHFRKWDGFANAERLSLPILERFHREAQIEAHGETLYEVKTMIGVLRGPKDSPEDSVKAAYSYMRGFLERKIARLRGEEGR